MSITYTSIVSLYLGIFLLYKHFTQKNIIISFSLKYSNSELESQLYMKTYKINSLETHPNV